MITLRKTFFALLPITTVLACAAEHLGSESMESPVVGGAAEDRYGAVGYLAVGGTADTLFGPNCGVTLIAPDVAVTAAHCIKLVGYKRFGFGIGKVADHKMVPATSVFVHPRYNPDGLDPDGPRYTHDVAILKLARAITDITPMLIGPASLAPVDADAGGLAAADDAGVIPGLVPNARYVGYGRVEAGGFNHGGGYTNERKSAAFSVTRISDYDVFARGVNGGNCWGDSGGPLIDEAGSTLYGVLADFDLVFDCQVGNKMIYTNLDRERAFIDLASTCVAAEGYRDTLPGSCGGPADAGVGDASDGGSDISDASAGDAGDAGDGGTNDGPFLRQSATLGPLATQSYASTLLQPGRYTITLAHGAGDPDLFVRVGGAATTTLFDCASTGPTPDERCDLTLTTPGMIYALVQNSRNMGTATYTITGAPAGWAGVTVQGALVRGQSRSVETGTLAAGTYHFSLTGGSGDPDLFLRVGAAPTSRIYDCASTGPTSQETCTITLIRPQSIQVLVENAGFNTAYFNLVGIDLPR